MDQRSEKLWQMSNNLLPHERGALFGYVWSRMEGHSEHSEFFLNAVSEWLDRRYPPNVLMCPACEARFHDTAQSKQEQDEGICPGCGYEGVGLVKEGLIPLSREGGQNGREED